jgi:catechol 2,3-dioxygenase-like lactoylglutathione lyase family enzyme
MAQTKYDRKTQDVGNILGMEHVNVTVPDQELALRFYISGLGLTRDPYMMVGPENMWVNVGDQQFHLPTRDPQVFTGCIGLVVSDLDALQRRLTRLEDKLSGTAFGWKAHKDYVEVTCPWGNQIRCHAPGPEFGDISLGMPYVEVLVKPRTARGIAGFYRTVMNAPATVVKDEQGTLAQVGMGRSQVLRFRETDQSLPEYDGHHIAVYVADFSSPHAFLKRHKLITEESNDYQYRFQAIVNPKTGKPLCELEHEVRSLYHPMYGRELVNRNSAQNIFAYARGRDAFVQ